MAGNPVDRLSDDINIISPWIRRVDGSELGEQLIKIRESIDRLEAAFADGLRRFDTSREYTQDGALSCIDWLRWKCRLSGGAAAERVGIARQLDKLPKTEEAFAQGIVGYEHVAAIARTAEHVGAAAVRKEEAHLLQEAQTHDPGKFVGVVKHFEHRVDAEQALAQANKAYERRYLHMSQSSDGLFHLDGLLDPEGGASLQTALNSVMKPSKDDERSTGQRRADALVDLSRRLLNGSRLPDVAGQRPHLIITCSSETLAGIPGAPAGELEWSQPIPSETVRRLACDAAVNRITTKGVTRIGGNGASDLEELAAEISHASRTIPPHIRKALVARDHGCVFPGCGRPASWTEAHHLWFWADGGPTAVWNLALLCRRHHIMVHEGGWRLERKNGRFNAIRPERKVLVNARSA